MYSDSKSNQQSPTIQIPVYLNVYNFWGCFNRFCEPFGIGVYHTGVQFYDDEYMYFGFDGNETGVGYIEPFEADYEFKEQILLGYSSLTFFQFDQKILDPLRVEFTGNKYDLLGNNCNHFARRLTKQLKVDEKFPSKIFRITDFCNLFRCCIPQCILNGRLDWFYSSSSEKESGGYYELQESVKEQFDIKILHNEKEKTTIKLPEGRKEQGERKSIENGSPSFQRWKQQSVRLSHTEPHHDLPKHTTLRKGIWPHLETAHERATLNQLPNVSPRSLGRQSARLQQSRSRKQSAFKNPVQEDGSIYIEKKQQQK